MSKISLAFNEANLAVMGLYDTVYDMYVDLQTIYHSAIEQLDKETLATVNSFFENNLNISETARKMYLHRNTLGYRLDKITRTTGLDVKTFDDALTFKIALMVSDHMKFLRSQE